MRTSFSAPNLSNGVVTNLEKLSLSSLKDILYDETGSLLVSVCVSGCTFHSLMIFCYFSYETIFQLRYAYKYL